MKTCVSMECPFLMYCKDYNFLVDREAGCKTQDALMRGAERLKKQKKFERKMKNEQTKTKGN